MYINRLEANNFKGRNFSHQLEKNVLITGPNFAGKTARLQAIIVALRGHDPELGKTLAATRGLASGSQMKVLLKFDNGALVERSFNQTPNAEGVKVNIAGIDLEHPMPLLNSEEYFGLTESERIQYIFRAMQMPDTYTVEAITADARNIELEANTEHTERARAKVTHTIEKALKENGISGGLTMLTKDGGILKTEFSYYNKQARDSIGTVRLLTELKLRENECSADTIASIEEEIERLDKELASANQDSGKLTSRTMESNRIGIRRREIEAALAAPAPKPDAARVKELEKIIKGEGAKASTTITKQKLDELEQAWHDAEEGLTTNQATIEAIEQAVMATANKLKELKKLKACPTCNAASKDWKSKATKEYQRELNEQDDKIGTLVEKGKGLTKKADAAKKAFNKAKTEIEDSGSSERNVQLARNELDRLTADAAREGAKRDGIEAELENLKKSPAPPTDADLKANASLVQELQTSLAKLKERHTSLVQLQQDLIRAAEAAAEHEKAAAHATVIKAAGAMLQKKQAEMVNVLFGDLLKTANYFASDILIGELAFHEGEIGRFVEGRFVSHETFSGTEKAITYIAIAAALSKGLPFRLVLLDEMGRLDATNKIKVLDRFSGAVDQGVIDQVVAIDTAPPAEIGQWQVIKLAEETKPKGNNGKGEKSS